MLDPILKIKNIHCPRSLAMCLCLRCRRLVWGSVYLLARKASTSCAWRFYVQVAWHFYVHFLRMALLCALRRAVDGLSDPHLPCLVEARHHKDQAQTNRAIYTSTESSKCSFKKTFCLTNIQRRLVQEDLASHESSTHHQVQSQVQ